MFITPCTSKMQEFLVRMEINSRTMSKGLWLRQLSSVGSRWEISLLPAHTSVCSSQLLLAGQSLMCFFKLKDRGETSSENNSQIEGSDVRLGENEDNQVMFDVSRTPLVDFHHYERLHQEKYFKEALSTVDFILLSHLVEDDNDSEKTEKCHLLSHHACHHSIIGKSPVWWLMNGPQTISHDFSTSFCEATFYITLHNSSDVVASVKIVTLDGMSSDSGGGQTQDTSPHSDSSTIAGWHNISLGNDDVKVEKKIWKQRVLESVSPFIWSATSSTHIKLEPMNIIKVPLRICIFSPGVYDLSKYELHWSLQSSDPPTRFSKDTPATWQSSGVNRGHPFFLTVMQSHDNPKM
ncbi:hypothetical protein ZOSMA_391G00040 [Zostera marina]|uniref:TPPC8 C-terminal Ig-like domain-containing protein n=1 Tax=Zostera marina TaxID=29655 RepID=A0A0K9P4E8_ZOSMR|nr:hypothetical protein ZOSMA_391G00040 [Zostera marina]